jgi:hypothetical protein
MMKIKGIYIFILLGMLSAGAYAGEFREITLVDGSAIYGQVVSFNNGVYTIKSNSLGTIKIEESDIQQIRVKPCDANKGEHAAASNPAINAEIQTLHTLMENDQEIMNKINSLQNDPDFQEIMRDPAIINALNSGNIAALISNPKFMRLLNNETVQEIQKKLVQ